MYEFLLSADLMVPDPDGHTELLVKRLGVLSRADYRQAFPGHGYIAHFLRVNRSLAVAPTRLEPQHHWDVPEPVDPLFGPYLDSLHEFQGRFRPIKTHSCVIACSDMDALMEKFHRRKLPYRVSPVDSDLAWDRVWVGTTPEQPRYTPVVDGGLCLEWHPVAPLRIPEKTFVSPPPGPQDDLPPGGMVRIVSRAFLVHDLDDTLRRLDTNLDLVPNGPVREFPGEGFRMATIGFTLAHSGVIDIIEPTSAVGRTGRYLHTWGPGPYYIRIAVLSLEAKAADLDERGTRYTRVEHDPAVGGPLLRVDPRDLDGTIIEFVEYTG